MCAYAKHYKYRDIDKRAVCSVQRPCLSHVVMCRSDAICETKRDFNCIWLGLNCRVHTSAHRYSARNYILIIILASRISHLAAKILYLDVVALNFKMEKIVDLSRFVVRWICGVVHSCGTHSACWHGGTVHTHQTYMWACAMRCNANFCIARLLYFNLIYWHFNVN